MDEKTLARFMAKVEKQTEVTSHHVDTPCWLWTASARNGYGQMTIGSAKNGTRRVAYAHRLAFAHWHGGIPHADGHHGACICHRCDERLCVNPAHLFAGSQAANVADAVAKGIAVRPPHHRGQRHPQAKLSNTDVLEIVRLVDAGSSASEVARAFGVTVQAVSLILRGKNWGWLTGLG